MGRVYEALKRAAEGNGAKGQGIASEEAASHVESNGARLASNGDRAASESVASVVMPLNVPEHTHVPAPQFNAPDAAHRSAPIERTGQSVGSALPDGRASRVAGATLGAAGSARTVEFQTLEISAARVEPHLVAITQPNSSHAERFRSLRTRVLHAGERKKMHAFVVTSAGIMEGKTMTAINLAWLLAQTDGVRALLIDGDLRNPCVGDYLGIDAPVGLSDILSGDATLAEAIIKLEPAGLHLLPGGESRDDVAEILSGPRFSQVLNEARGMFDYIIIDTPPLGIFTDATVLISRADGALVVARSGKTRYGALERLLEPLPRASLLGVVLNGADEPAGESQNYYYRRRYGRRDEAKEIVEEKA